MVSVAHQDSSLVAGAFLCLPDVVRKIDALHSLTFIFPKILTRKVNNGEQKFLDSRHIESSNRQPTRLADRAQEIRMKSYKNMYAFIKYAGSVVVLF